MADRRISELGSIAASVDDDDVYAVVDTSTETTKKFDHRSLKNVIGAHFASRSDAVTEWAAMVSRSETPPVGTVWTWPDAAIRYDGAGTSVADFTGWVEEYFGASASTDVVAAQAAAEDARDGAVAAAASIGVYADTTLANALVTGLAAASEGETFHATGDDVDYIGVYKDLSGVAVEQATYPKFSYLDNYALKDSADARWFILADKTSENDVFSVSASVSGSDLIIEILDTIFVQTPFGTRQISAAGPFTLGGGQCLKIDLTGTYAGSYTVTQSNITSAIMAEQGRGETLILLQRLTARVAGPLAPMVMRVLDTNKIDEAQTKADRFASPVQGNAFGTLHDHTEGPTWRFGRKPFWVTGLTSPYWYTVQPPFSRNSMIAINEGTHTADLTHLMDGSVVLISSRYGCDIYAGDGVNFINSSGNNLANLPADGLVRVTKLVDHAGTKVALESLAGTPTYSASSRPTMGASILLAGQSQWELGATAGGIGGFEDELVNALSPTNGNYVTKDGTARHYIVGATSGSAADMRSNLSNYWWNASAGTPGPALTNCISEITTATGAGQPAPVTIMWRQGEADMAAIDDGTITQAQYVATLGAIFDYIIANGAGVSPKFIVTPPGANDLALYFNGAMGVQAGYLDLISARSDVFLGPAMFDLPRGFEDVHPTDLGYYTLGVRDAVAYAKYVNGESSLSLGPQITSATLAGDGLSVALTITSSGQLYVPTGSAGGYVDAGPYPFGFCAIIGDPSTQDPITLTQGEVTGYTGFQTSATVTLRSDTDLTGARIYTLPGQFSNVRERRYITDKREHGCAMGFPMPFQRTAVL